MQVIVRRFEAGLVPRAAEGQLLCVDGLEMPPVEAARGAAHFRQQLRGVGAGIDRGERPLKPDVFHSGGRFLRTEIHAAVTAEVQPDAVEHARADFREAMNEVRSVRHWVFGFWVEKFSAPRSASRMPAVKELLDALAVYALRHAPEIPLPSAGVPESAERDADAYCLALSRDEDPPLPSPEICAALLPRLRCARMFRSRVESELQAQARLGDSAATEGAAVKWLLVKMWHAHWKERWLAGEFQ